MKTPLVLGLLCAAGLSLPVSADPLATVTAGGTWSADVEGGPTVRMTLRPDGTGRVRLGPIGRKVTWVPHEGGLCIANLPGGNGDGPRCFTVTATGSGYQMTAADGGRIALSPL